MKRLLTFVLLILPLAVHAQDLSVLTNLHPRPQVSYLYSNQPSSHFSNAPERFVLTDSNASVSTLKAVAYLQREYRKLTGDTLRRTHNPHDRGQGIVIFVGTQNEAAIQNDIQSHSWLFSDSLNRAEAYLIDVSSPSILVAGADSNGVFNGVTTLLQLLKATKSATWDIPALHIYDWPDYPLRWVFSSHNMMVPAQVDAVKAIEDSMAAHKLNGLQQNDFKYSILDRLDSYYFGHVDSMRVHAEQNNISVIPGVCTIGWSQAELIHDPDMAEGFRTTSSYVIQGDTGTLIGDPRVTLPNGNFENATGGAFPGWGWVDTTVHVDSSTTHSGRFSARAEHFGNSAPNGRFIKLLSCPSHHGYHLSAWVKTQNFKGEFNLLAIGFHDTVSQALTYTQFNIPATCDWQRVNVIFNTAGFNSMYVYCGVWSGVGGTIWMDDFQIEDAGMTNILHRADEMPVVSRKGETYTSGQDYADIVDSIMEKANGSYTWHQSPTLRILPNSKIKTGDTVNVDFIRANPVLNDPSGDGSTMVCVSEDTLYSIMQDQVHRVDSLLHKPDKYFISHDEIRQMNWDKACTGTTANPAELLAQNVEKCTQLVSNVHPNADLFDWSDMFDPYHNAHNNYYLVNGDLSGVWNIIPKSLTILNWNSGFMDSSLAFFGKLGFNQMTSPYYDEHDTRNIREWRKAMERNPQGMRGMMYTTWANDYTYLMAFADYAWSAGPMIIHRSLDVNADSIVPYKYQFVFADILTDPYDATDRIDSVTYWQYYSLDGKPKASSWQMQHDTASRWRFVTDVQSDAGTDITYQITAKNRQGITRSTPRYFLFHMPDATQSVMENDSKEFAIYPNPASDRIELSFSHSTNINVEILNSLGTIVKTAELAPQESTIDTKDLPAGAYTMRIKDGAETHSRSFVIVR